MTGGVLDVGTAAMVQALRILRSHVRPAGGRRRPNYDRPTPDLNGAHAHGTITQDQPTLGVAVGGHSLVVWRLQGAWVGSVVFEASVDGDTFEQWAVNTEAGEPGVFHADGPGRWSGNCAGLSAVRVRMSDQTSGAVEVLVLVVE